MRQAFINTPSQDPRFGYLDGYDVRFIRRKYGRKTYTWVEAKKDEDEQWESLGDPWPCISPSRREIHQAVLATLYKQGRKAMKTLLIITLLFVLTGNVGAQDKVFEDEIPPVTYTATLKSRPVETTDQLPVALMQSVWAYIDQLEKGLIHPDDVATMQYMTERIQSILDEHAEHIRR